MIAIPGLYSDRRGRTAHVIMRADHNPSRWLGFAGDGYAACWEADGGMECSLPSDEDILRPAPLRLPALA